jgi:hypothetical protein
MRVFSLAFYYLGAKMKVIYRILRGIVGACLLAWISVSIIETELLILTNSSYNKYMAHDLFYGYLSVKTFYENIVYIAIFNFIIGFIIGFVWKPQNIQHE